MVFHTLCPDVVVVVGRALKCSSAFLNDEFTETLHCSVSTGLYQQSSDLIWCHHQVRVCPVLCGCIVCLGLITKCKHAGTAIYSWNSTAGHFSARIAQNHPTTSHLWVARPLPMWSWVAKQRWIFDPVDPAATRRHQSITVTCCSHKKSFKRASNS